MMCSIPDRLRTTHTEVNAKCVANYAGRAAIPWDMGASDRLKAAREAAGFKTAVEAAERFDWPPTTYYGHENGSRGITKSAAEKYARAFGIAPEAILFDRPEFAEVEPRFEAGSDLIPVYNVAASAGHGSLLADPEMVVDQLSFPRGYLRRITSANPRDLAIISVKGDSMSPTLSHDDVVMIDTGKRDLSFDGLFVLRDGGASLLVKRIGRGSRRGTVILISDNKTYPAMERDAADIEVVGKVVWFGVKV